VTAPDSSVLIAGADPSHPFFEAARAALVEVRRDGRLVAHTVAETFSVLTAGAYAHPPGRVVEYLRQFCARAPIGIAPAGYPSAIEELARAGVAGGATYDGLIALAAREGGVALVSLDRRASTTYGRCGIDFRLLLPDDHVGRD
jgi:predicted nucleic acid-binding protein